VASAKAGLIPNARRIWGTTDMAFSELRRRIKFGSIRPVPHFLNSGDLAVFAHLLGLRRWLDRGRIDLVIDVGGNIGQFASALRYIGYRGDILSFEPIPDAFAALSHRMHGDERWHGMPIAIGDHVGEDTLNIMAETVFSSFRPRVTQNESASDTVREKLVVPVRTLESVIDEMNLVSRLSRTLIKSDTQGYELSVLRGLGNHIDLVKLVQCELSSIPLYDGSPFMTEIIDFLHQHHFQSLSFAPVNGESVRPLEFDYLCVNDAVA
jgi:FkbM family methyltransferase